MRSDAATDEQAALGVEGKGKIAGKLSEKRTKSIDRAAARREASCASGPRDRRCVALLHVHRFEQANRVVEIFEAVAGERALRRHVPEFLPQLLKDRILVRRRAGHCGVTAFAACHDTALLPRDVGGNAES